MGVDLFWDQMQGDVEAIVADYRGVAAVYLVDPNSGRHLDINADLVLAAGSSIKVPVLMELYRKASEGALDLDEPVEIGGSDIVGGSGVLQHLEGHVELTLRNLAILMINLSDNVATNLCISRAGMDDVNAMLDDIGCSNTRLQRVMIDWKSAARGLENISTAREMARWIEVMHLGQWERRDLCDEVLAVLRKGKDTPIRRGVPQDIPIAGKTGGLEGVRCEVALVCQNRLPYVLSVMTAFGIDEDNSEVITEIARTVHDYMGVLETFSEYGRGLPVV